MRESTPENWKELWTKRDIDEVYPTSEKIIENLLKVTEVTGKRVLEVGAGSGRDSIRLARLGAEVYVLDYVVESLVVVKQLAEREKLTVHCILGDALDLPILSDSFDIVFHQGLLEHFRTPKDDRLLAENHRILKPGGLAQVDVPQTFHIYTVIKQILIALDKWFAGWEKQFTITQLRRQMKKVGLEEVHSYGEWMVPSLFYRIVREVLWKLKIARLPLYPPKIPVLHPLRVTWRYFCQQFEWAKWTYLTIGVIGKKSIK